MQMKKIPPLTDRLDWRCDVCWESAGFRAEWFGRRPKIAALRSDSSWRRESICHCTTLLPTRWPMLQLKPQIVHVQVLTIQLTEHSYYSPMAVTKQMIPNELKLVVAVSWLWFQWTFQTKYRAKASQTVKLECRTTSLHTTCQLVDTLSDLGWNQSFLLWVNINYDISK